MSNIQSDLTEQSKMMSALTYEVMPLSTAEESSAAGGARLSYSEFAGAAVPGAQGSFSISGSVSGSFVQSSYSGSTSVRNSRGASAGKRSFFFGSIFDLF